MRAAAGHSSRGGRRTTQRRPGAPPLLLLLLLLAWAAAPAAALMPTLLLPPMGPAAPPHGLGYDMLNITAEMLDLGAPTEAHNNTQCREDSLFYRHETLAAVPWALQMYDASTKVPDGLLTGNVVQLGNFDECLSTHATDEAGAGLFWGEYCLAELHVSPPENDTEAAAAEGGTEGDAEGDTEPPPRPAPRPVSANHTFKNHLAAAMEGHALQWAVCLPASCGPADLQLHLQERMEQLLLAHGDVEALQVRVRPRDCYRARPRLLDHGDWAAILLFSTMFAVVIAATAYDYTHPEAGKDSLLLAFSARRNVQALFSTRASGQMASVNGIKFLSMAWVVLFHKYCVMEETPSVNRDIITEGLLYDWSQMPLSNGGTMAVNTFFVVGGLLLAHGFLRERDSGRPFSLARFYIYRYIRLAPPYAAIVTLYATLMFHMGTGPLWNATVEPHRVACRKHWWRNLLFINNYQSVTSEMCAVHTWYLAADMQLFWLSPLLLWPLWRRPRAGGALLLALLLVPLAVPFWLTYTRNYPWADKGLTDEVRNSYFPLIHASAFARAAPFLVGVGLACVLRETNKDSARIPTPVVAAAWAAVLAASWVITYAVFISYQPGHAYNPLEAAFFQALHPLGWGLLVAWLIFACERGYAGPVRKLLSLPCWQPLSRLTYTAYLVHFVVFYYDLGTARSPAHYSHYAVLHSVLGDLAFVLALATLLALAFELPVINLHRALTRPQEKPAQPDAERRPSVAVVTAEARANGSVNPAFEGDSLEDVQVTKM